jgi:hypothetical protein
MSTWLIGQNATGDDSKSHLELDDTIQGECGQDLMELAGNSTGKVNGQ